MQKGYLSVEQRGAVGREVQRGEGYIKSVAVYCGSRLGAHDEYAMEAYKLGFMLAEQGYKVVFGGGNFALMGAVKEGALAYNLPRGVMDGVIEYNPEFFHGGQGVGGEGIISHVVPDMFERKKNFINSTQLSISLAGGIGSGDEIFDVLVAADTSPLAAPDRPVPRMILVDTQGLYSEGLLPYIQKTVDEGFTAADRVEQVLSLVPDAKGVISLLDELNSKPPFMPHQLAKKQNAQNTDFRAVFERNATAMNAFLAERGEKPLFGQSNNQPVQGVIDFDLTPKA